jgi:hypothetical protein
LTPILDPYTILTPITPIIIYDPYTPICTITDIFAIKKVDMGNGANKGERTVWEAQFPDCERVEQRHDVIFVYPATLMRDTKSITDHLQSAMDYLKHVTNIDPSDYFTTRVIVGYTRQSTQPNWSGIKGNRVHVPWKYLDKEDEPLDSCSHELVHPFYNRSSLHDSNEKWGDCFCEFLRGPVKHVMGLDGISWWHKKLQDEKQKKDNWGNVAGQFLLKAKEELGNAGESPEDFADRIIQSPDDVKTFVFFLFDRFSELTMSSEFRPTSKVE